MARLPALLAYEDPYHEVAGLRGPTGPVLVTGLVALMMFERLG